MLTTDRLPFFVYGTLRSGEGNYRWALDGRTTSEQRGTLAGATMVSNGGFPFVFNDSDQSKIVVGEVMTVADHDYDEVQNALDGLEGFLDEGNPMNLYDRVVVDITLETGQAVPAFTYLAAPGMMRRVSAMPLVESGDWVEFVRSLPGTSAWYDDADDTDEAAAAV